MIKWKSNFGHSIEIEFLGYQFPEINDGWDANWLNVKVNAKNENNSWTKTSACSLAWDVLNLQHWLTEVVERENENDSFMLSEFDLEIKYIANSLKKHVFAIVLRAGLSISDTYCDIIFVNVSDRELKDATEYLNKSFSAFPPRGEVGRSHLKYIINNNTEQKH